MPAPPNHEAALYVHLRWDGGILITETSGDSSFVSEQHLRDELDALKGRGGTVLYSREHPDHEPPQWVVNTFRLIASYDLPLRLLDAPAPSIARDDSKRRPRTLMAAAYTGNDRWTGELIARGLPVDEPDKDGQTALMYAAKAGHHAVVRLLLAAGADANAGDNDGNTPLMFAAQHGHRTVVDALVADGAMASARGSHGLTARDLATQNGHIGLLSVLPEPNR